jgi:hypothetical protein
MGKLDHLGNAVRSVIRAYHGSPHDFDRFDASKIGTGEGAQAYGHGLYFSEAEPVAEWYRRELSGPPEIIVGGEPIRWIAPTKTPRERALRLLQKSAAAYYDDPVQAMREAMLDAGDQYGGRDAKPIIASLMRLKSDGVRFGPRPGKTYEVEIDFPEDRFLDYDARLEHQPPYVRERLARLDYSAPHLMREARETGGGGQAIIDAARYSYPTTPSAGSKILADAGIPGVRYLDEYSRGASVGTRNYVAFPGAEDSIRILRKYAVPGAVGTGVASQYEEER